MLCVSVATWTYFLHVGLIDKTRGYPREKNWPIANKESPRYRYLNWPLYLRVMYSCSCTIVRCCTGEVYIRPSSSAGTLIKRHFMLLMWLYRKHYAIIKLFYSYCEYFNKSVNFSIKMARNLNLSHCYRNYMVAIISWLFQKRIVRITLNI